MSKSKGFKSQHFSRRNILASAAFAAGVFAVDPAVSGTEVMPSSKKGMPLRIAGYRWQSAR
jgi:hypothetical protein